MATSKSLTSNSRRKERRKGERRGVEIRDITKTDHEKVTTGKSTALSSHKALFFHDIPPELIRRIAKRYTGEIKDGKPSGGHLKYGTGHLNLNWRVGLDDVEYVVDRFNHLVDHLLDFSENLNDFDDNLAAMAWCIGFLMEAERLAPEVFREAFGQCKLFGEQAKLKNEELKAGLK